MPAIETSDLGKTYDDGTRALANLTLQIEPGSIFGLLGPNGAGKSTTVRLLNGTLRPTTGTSTVLGLPAGDDRIRSRSATVAELARLYEHMSVADNLRFFGRLYGLAPAEIEQRMSTVLVDLEVEERRDDPLGALSTGLKQRIQLARALLHRPQVMFLDEPTAGLDPDSARHVIGLVRSLAQKEGTTVLLCTHNLGLAERICTGYGFLVGGRLVWSGSRANLLAASGQPTVRITTTDGPQEFPIEGDRDITPVLQRVLATGAHVIDVRKVEPSLEESYFRIVEGAGA